MAALNKVSESGPSAPELAEKGMLRSAAAYPARTEPESSQALPSFSAALTMRTNAVLTRGARIVLDAKDVRAEPPILSAVDATKAIKAVIGPILNDAIILHCTNNDREFNVRLPTSLIPDELRIFGKPVNVTLGMQDGVRLPVVKSRDAQDVGRKEDHELDQWIDGL